MQLEISLLDESGNVVVKYSYDAWGTPTVEVLNSDYADLSQLNPFRYRGYYYDTETGLYFLKTRYYDPEVGRFITIDDLQYLDPESINGLNLYAYCANNPVMNVDPNGTSVQDFLTLLERIFSGLSSIYYSFAKIVESVKKVPKGWAGSERAFNRLSKQAATEATQMGKTLGNIGNVLAVITLVIDIGVAWYNNYESGNSNWVSDSIVDTVYIGLRFAIGYPALQHCLV